MSSDHSAHRDNLIGSLFMVAAMAVFALEDSFVKQASTHLPIAEVLMLYGGMGAVLFALYAKSRGERLFVVEVGAPVMRIRACFELTGRLFYALALALTTLSSSTIILQATPIVVVLGAALFFGERVGWRRWAAILVGLLGVVLIIRPGTGDFSPLSILALISVFGFAGRDLASRAAPKTLSAALLGFYGFLTIVLAGGLYGLYDGKAFLWPDGEAMLALCAASLFGALAYGCLMAAMRTGEVSTVTPFRYTRLIFGVAMGALLFGESLDLITLLGGLIIAGSGLYILIAGRRAAKYRTAR